MPVPPASSAEVMSHLLLVRRRIDMANVGRQQQGGKTGPWSASLTGAMRPESWPDKLQRIVWIFASSMSTITLTFAVLDALIMLEKADAVRHRDTNRIGAEGSGHGEVVPERGAQKPVKRAPDRPAEPSDILSAKTRPTPDRRGDVGQGAVGLPSWNRIAEENATTS